MDADHALLASDVTLPEIVRDEVAVDEPLGLLADDHRTRVGQRLDARREVDGVADGGVGHVQVGPDRADHDRPAVRVRPGPET